VNRNASANVDFRLYLITDRKLVAPRPLPDVCDAVLGALTSMFDGIGVALQLREKDLDGRELYELALALRPICTRHRARLLINDRIDVALAAGADGVHLPGDSFAIPDARALLGASRLIGISTHSVEDAAAASAAGADFAVFGPVWAPLSKPAYGAAHGAEPLDAVCRAASRMPIFALGGMTAARVAELTVTAGVAAIGAVFGANDPPAAAVALAAAIRRAGLAPR
jgi:thiamine-phosphate pyrophosphorylase